MPNEHNTPTPAPAPTPLKFRWHSVAGDAGQTDVAEVRKSSHQHLDDTRTSEIVGVLVRTTIRGVGVSIVFVPGVWLECFGVTGEAVS